MPDPKPENKNDETLKSQKPFEFEDLTMDELKEYFEEGY